MIGIVTPYDCSEMTACALRLADAVIATGHDVRVVAADRRGKIHPYWDRKVWRVGAGTGVVGCDAVVHFQINRKSLLQARLVAPAVRQILVLPWHAVTAESLLAILDYDTIVLPSLTAYLALVSKLHVGNNVANLAWGWFDAGLLRTARTGNVTPDRVRAVFVANSTVIDFCGPGVLGVINKLLTEFPRLDVTMLSSRSWPEHDRKSVKTLRADFGARFTYTKQGGILETVEAFYLHDWVVLPGTRYHTTVAAAQALGCGAPVIAHDIAPVNEIIRHGKNGLLVPCESTQTDLGAPTAIPDLAALTATCRTAFASPDPLIDLRNQDWPLDFARTRFHTVWTELLGLGETT